MRNLLIIKVRPTTPGKNSVQISQALCVSDVLSVLNAIFLVSLDCNKKKGRKSQKISEEYLTFSISFCGVLALG